MQPAKVGMKRLSTDFKIEWFCLALCQEGYCLSTREILLYEREIRKDKLNDRKMNVGQNKLNRILSKIDVMAILEIITIW